MSASALPYLVHLNALPGLSAEGAEGHRQLPMPAEMYGVAALLIFLLLLALLWSFRGAAYKVRDKHSKPAGGGHH
ncbi:MAG TPA: hypothetical protein P5181_15395 [Dermatophilaceae bacterium]|mgnify:CR=1 FL=1|nr:hypothetical protein [Dermatophilaceae bacterium]